MRKRKSKATRRQCKSKATQTRVPKSSKAAQTELPHGMPSNLDKEVLTGAGAPTDHVLSLGSCLCVQQLNAAESKKHPKHIVQLAQLQGFPFMPAIALGAALHVNVRPAHA